MKNHKALFILCGLMAVLLLIGISSTDAKEVTLSQTEWLELGEEDSVPAGAHIRLDLSTGKRYAKLIDPNDENDKHQDSNTNKNHSLSVSNHNNANQNDTLIKLNATNIDSLAEVGDVRISSKDNIRKYDFDLMYRALAHLPSDQFEQIDGGFPDHIPDISNVKERAVFEKTMAELWENRQALLKELMAQSDTVAVLKDYVQVLSDFALHQKEEDEETVLDVLYELEGLLSDVDMARDFHTLGGWPFLVNLLASPQQQHYKSNIRSAAAWAIGTAVKNTAEFGPWAVEENSGVEQLPTNYIVHSVSPLDTNGTDDISPHRVVPINSITSIIHVFQEYNGNNFNGNTDDTIISASLDNKLLLKVLYALGSLLRGNPVVQEYFIKLSGHLVLGRALEKSMPLLNNDDMELLVSKLLLLSHDLVEESVSSMLLENDEVDHPHGINILVSRAFTTEVWCNAAIAYTSFSTKNGDLRTKENSAAIIKSMAPFCNRHRDTVNKDKLWSSNAELLMKNIFDGIDWDQVDEEWKAEIDLLHSETMNKILSLS